MYVFDSGKDVGWQQIRFLYQINNIDYMNFDKGESTLMCLLELKIQVIEPPSIRYNSKNVEACGLLTLRKE